MAPVEMRTSNPLFKPAVIIHGGAGNIDRSRLPPELYEQYRASLLSYVQSTYALLNGRHEENWQTAQKASDEGKSCLNSTGCSALDAAVHAVSLMEDDPLFNCGRGSVFTTAGTIEMEASVMVCSVMPSDMPGKSGGDTGDEMVGARIKRGAGVMMVKNVRHPIRLAKEVLIRTGHNKNDGEGGSMHSQLCGPYVEELARDWDLEFKPDEWFWTKRRWDEHRRGMRGPKTQQTIGHEPEQDLACDFEKEKPPSSDEDIEYLSQGTVGAVCLDKWGNIAVATSTGGLTNKFPGRIGDTPTLGAGFWAENWTVFDDTGSEFPSDRQRAIGVSGTGNGDSFLRLAAARTAGAMARFSQLPFAEAITAISGPGGELERSAGDRWGKSGEGAGGMIGVEAEWICRKADDHDWNPGLSKGIISFDFNCNGMFRAWIEEDMEGVDQAKMMVFRDEYQ